MTIVGDANATGVDPGQGYELATVSLTSSPMPTDIHYPFLYAIGNELDRIALTLEDQEQDLAGRLNKLNRNVLNKILRGRTIRELHQERQDVAKRLAELEPTIRAVTAVANEKMRTLAP